MKMTKMIAACAMLALASSPTLAAAAPANPAAKLSLSPQVRAGSSVKGANKLADGPTTITALFLGGLAIAAIVLAIANGGDDDKPASA